VKPDPTYPRDLIGYGRNPPHARWPGNARVALQFVLNYEEGGENCVLHGDKTSEQFLSEIIGAPAFEARHLSMESIYEYGSRAGVWRILREFERRDLPLTIFGVSMALERNPEATAAFVELGHEIACHGWRWIHYQNVDEATEREHMRIGMEITERLTARRPLGWYTGRDSPNTRRLVADYGGFEYDSDYYGDDLPFWVQVRKSDGGLAPHLVVPYTLDANDMRFALPQGFSHGDEFFEYLRDSFDVLYGEGGEHPAMMSVGMHCRLLGRPGRMRALQRFLDHVEHHDRVWIRVPRQPLEFAADRGPEVVAVDQRRVEPHAKSRELRKDVRSRRVERAEVLRGLERVPRDKQDGIQEAVRRQRRDHMLLRVLEYGAVDVRVDGDDRGLRMEVAKRGGERGERDAHEVADVQPDERSRRVEPFVDRLADEVEVVLEDGVEANLFLVEAAVDQQPDRRLVVESHGRGVV
jgi:putative urate catabolism protein